MRVLLDTCSFLWLLSEQARLSGRARDVIGSAEELYLSAASAWEIGIKTRLGHFEFAEPPALLVPAEMQRRDITPLEVIHSHALHVAELPLHHRDPFDRLLVAQCQLEELVLLSPDPAFERYAVQVTW